MPALLALGFRPFYLLAGAYAALSVPLWALQYFGVLPPVQPLWHAHEMIFGYAFAVIAGFLLTAVCNWTGRETPSGAPLAALAAIWVAARLIAPYSLAASSLVDLLFAIGLAWGIGRPILASRNRNWFFILIVLAIGAASVLFAFSERAGLQVGLDMVLLVIAIMAGRVVPSFTNNAIPGAGARRLQSLEYAALAALVAILVLDLFQLEKAAAMVALLAAALHAVRLALWAPLATRGRPILWILHLSYAWIVVHLAMRGLAEFGLVPPVLATHALTVGAIGGITLGMMTRTARGHTGRPLAAGRAEMWAYSLVQAAAFVRVLVPLAVPAAYLASVAISATLWFLAFATFAVAYLPVLSQPRLDGKPG
ncbi:MAG TPA: NnrS family protein [Burkholderiales bacterium]|nr:NnrS family protein [Burkholderiales bacterium]